jgi:hypothetical protein
MLAVWEGESPAVLGFVGTSSRAVSRALRGAALREPKPWLTPKSDSLEAFLPFALRIVTEITVLLVFAYAAARWAITGQAPGGPATALLVVGAALARRRAT